MDSIIISSFLGSILLNRNYKYLIFKILTFHSQINFDLKNKDLIPHNTIKLLILQAKVL